MFWRTFFLAFVFAFIPMSVTKAMPVLDQYNFTPSASGPEVRSDHWLVQTFTVGISGSLTQVEVWNFISYAFNPPDAPLIIELYETNGVTPVRTALASVSIPIPDVGTNPFFDRTVADFSSFSLNVSAGDLLAIVLRTESTLPGAFDWWGSIDGSTDFYPGGGAYVSSDGGNTWEELTFLFDFHFWTYIEPITNVNIDIIPSSKKNPVNPRSKGELMVAILTTEDFDASTVNASTVRFGPSAAEPARYRLDDVDSDSDWDLILNFNIQEAGIACGDTEATLTGQKFDGMQITGTDAIETVGCNNK